MSSHMQTIWPPTQDSIFGDTYRGVPNPMVPHVHPYPTRFHGPIYTVPGTAKPTYYATPYAKAPYMGFGAETTCAPMFRHVLPGGGLLDAAAGAAIGYVVAPTKAGRAAWTIVGAVAGYAAGLVGLVGTVGAGLVMKQRGR